MNHSPLRLGLIGGALDSAIGRTHHIASQMDNRWRIVAGCFSLATEMNNATACAIGVSRERTYNDWIEMLENEKGRLDAVAILTPIPTHAEIAIAALKLGYAVISEKALANSSQESRAIRATRDRYDGFLAVIYNYSGYPIIRELKHLIAVGRLGKILHVQAEMPQEGFLRLVGSDNRRPSPQAWRLKDDHIPTVSLDLGAHLHHLIYFLTSASPLEVCALERQNGHFSGIVDSVQCIATYSGGLSAQIWYGKFALGYTNGLSIRVFGSEGSAEWLQLNPEYLTFHDNCGNSSLISRSTNSAQICNKERYMRFKAGHPAGFIEAFANYYADLGDWLIRYQQGERKNDELVANIEIAEEGLVMMETISQSSSSRAWKKVIST